MRFEIEQQQRAEHPRVAHRHGQGQRARVDRSIREPKPQVQRNRTAVSALERCRQRIQQSREDERQRFEHLDRPLELARVDEPADAGIRHERPRIEAACEPLERNAFGPQTRGQCSGRQHRQLADRRQSPPAEHIEAAHRPRPDRCGLTLLDELLKYGERHVAQCRGGILHRNLNPVVGAGEQQRRGLRRGDCDARGTGTREVIGNRCRISQETRQT
jgi:hypothetical protein